MRSPRPPHKNKVLLIFFIIIIQITIIYILACYYNCSVLFYCSVPLIAMVLGMQYLLKDNSFENRDAK
ncbi:MAG: hypothetical protein H0U95_03410 [Bacteroidetes bacterium]|nr:hypothetical protein [Bacteroidota bacterium]